VLDPEEKDTFDGLVNQLRADDPAFADRLTRLEHPHHGWRLALAALLWMAAPVSVIFGDGTGLLMAIVALGYGLALAAQYPGPTDGTGRSWWSTPSGQHPGPSASGRR